MKSTRDSIASATTAPRHAGGDAGVGCITARRCRCSKHLAPSLSSRSGVTPCSRVRCRLAIWLRSSMLTAFLYDPVGRLHQLNQLCKPDAPPASACLKLWMNRSSRVGSTAGSTSARVAGDIRYENVSFSYAEGFPALESRFFSRAAWRNDRVSRRDWRREIDAGESARSLLRVRAAAKFMSMESRSANTGFARCAKRSAW